MNQILNNTSIDRLRLGGHDTMEADVAGTWMHEAVMKKDLNIYSPVSFFFFFQMLFLPFNAGST